MSQPARRLSPPPDRHVAAAERARAPLGFVALLASLGALNAFSTDIVIPALGLIADEMALADPNRRQWAVLAVFVGMAVSQLALGPIADRFGRRRAVFLGFAVFLLGAALSAAAPSFDMLLLGRLLQGLGGGGLRVVGLAITRDRFTGDEMARIVSMTTTVFVVMVFAAPLLGQAIAMTLGWRWVFGVLVLQCLATWAWFAAAQPETLRPEYRRSVSPLAMAATFRAILGHRRTLGCALALGGAFGSFALYLSSAQQIFGEVYELGALVPVAFGGVSLLYGATTVVNTRMVSRRGAAGVARAAITVLGVAGTAYALAFAALFDGVPPLWLYLAAVSVPIACFAMVYGNLQALALEPMGDRAGSASSMVAAMGTAIGVVMAGIGGALFDGTVVPLMAAFGISGIAGTLILAATHGGAAGRPDGA